MAEKAHKEQEYIFQNSFYTSTQEENSLRNRMSFSK